nr:MAG TPA: hypothetical protein [Caudoviricetes sp.]
MKKKRSSLISLRYPSDNVKTKQSPVEVAVSV